MGVSEIKNVGLIGAGNMAWNLGSALKNKDINIMQVYNRTPFRGKLLAEALGADYVADPGKITTDADLYIIAVSDDAIVDVSSHLQLDEQLVVHTAGAIDINVLQHVSKNQGVFYPALSFSSAQSENFKTIPLCLEANSPSNLKLLVRLAKKLSKLVYPIDSDTRRKLHLAAVFASNFTNFMYVISEEILKTNQLPPDILGPLIRQSCLVKDGGNFFMRQTGPAVRGDHAIIARHKELLASNRDYLEIYDLITNNIIKYKSQHGKL
ncbi:MAG: DUF2520 domain-containing protein [Bacteroidetes bacterium]|nr:DUF2520 domain-containing protein [Bacteroidota bacterium]